MTTNPPGEGFFAFSAKGLFEKAQRDVDTFYKCNDPDSLFNAVHFESGILRKSEIDPIGAGVVFDQKSGRFHFESREQTEAAAGREREYNEIARRVELLQKLSAMVQPEDQDGLSAAAATSLNSVQTALGTSVTWPV